MRLPPCRPVSEMVSAARRAEQLGFDEVWVPDSPLLWRELWVTLTAMALGTSRVRLGPCVTSPVIRDFSSNACAIVTLDELSNGRAVLGLGVGDSSVRTLGRSPARLSILRDTILKIRSLSSGKWQHIGSRQVHMKCAQERQSPVPIYVAASGPLALQLAGELADGVFLLTGIDRVNLEYALTNVRAGAGRAGRTLQELDLILSVQCQMGADARAARLQARPLCAFYALHAPETLRAAGITVPEPQPMPELYPDVNHCEDWDRAIEATAWIPDEVLEAFCEHYTLVGTPRRIIPRIEAALSFGIRHFALLGFSSYKLPMEIAEAFGKEIIPYFTKRESPGVQVQ